MATFLELSRMPALNLDGGREPGAKLHFYVTATVDDAAVYQDAALTMQHPQPVLADSNGVFPDIYLDDAVRYRAVATDAAGTVTYFDTDPINPMPDSVSQISAAVSQAQSAAVAAQSAADTAASVLEAVQEGNAESFVAKTGDTLSGDLLVQHVGAAALLTASGDGPTQFRSVAYTSGAAPASFISIRYRGTIISPNVINSGDEAGRWLFAAYDGSIERNVGRITTTVVAGAPSASDMQSRMAFSVTPASSVALTEIMRLDHSGGLQMFGANTVIDANRVHRHRSYTVSGLPTASIAGQTVYVSDEIGGPVLAFSDGANWRRTTDRAVVS